MYYDEEDWYEEDGEYCGCDYVVCYVCVDGVVCVGVGICIDDEW